MEVLLTGGMGYIGSHTAVQMIEAGMTPVILDNLCNSDKEVLNRIHTLTGKTVAFYEGDVRDKALLAKIFQEHPIQAVVHFAGLKAVGESVEKPLEYYDNNIGGSVALLEAMHAAQVKTIVFSSSATVYGDPAKMPITEETPLGETTNPYGTSKAMIERIYQDFYKTHHNEGWSIILLRYFNPVGAHKSGIMGEDPQGYPNNLFPYVSQVAVGRLPKINVYGNDYNTKDGTGVRDYIHVTDLADGHVVALQKLAGVDNCHIYNLGTGQGSSVLDVIHAFNKACGKELPYEICPRRAGDIATSYASPAKAKADLGWETHFDLQDMVNDTWNWQSKNPMGYKK